MKKLLLISLLALSTPCLAEGELELAKCLKNKGFVLYGIKDSKKPLQEKATKSQLDRFSHFQNEIEYVECTNNNPDCKNVNVYPSWFKEGKLFITGDLDLPKLSNISNCSIDNTKQSKVFRNSNWGDSKEEVKQSEKSSLIKEDSDALLYRDTLFGHEWQVLYIFVDNRLVRTKYILDSSFSNKTQYLSTYTEMIKQLGEKYKKPLTVKSPQDVSPWHEDYGQSIAFGYTNSYADWALPDLDTKILAIISGNIGKIDLVIQYGSMSLSVLEKEQTDKENQSKI